MAVLLLPEAFIPSASADQYTLRFDKSSTRTSWSHRLPNWQYSVPVRISSHGDSTSMLRISTSASLNYILDERRRGRTWQDNGSVDWLVNYPILGPKASIGISGRMSTRNATLQRQKIRNQTFGFNFQYKPLQRGPFRSLRASVTPGLITSSRVSRAKLDSTIQEKGIQYHARLSVAPDGRIAGKKVTTSLRLSKRDNTLKNNKDRSETLGMNFGYSLPHDVSTSFSVHESRTQRGVTRSVISEKESDQSVLQDTAIVADISQSRNTSLLSKVDFRLGRLKVDNSISYAENLNTNTASDDQDARNRYFGTDRQSKRWSLTADVSGKLVERLVSRTSLTYITREQRFLPVKLADDRVYRDDREDREDQSLSLHGSLDWQPADHHAISLSAQVRSTRDENPGARKQDRDTFRSASRLSYDGTMASGLRLTVGLGTSLLHRVNLHSSRSSDNSRNRDISLNVNTRYERLAAIISHSFGISARRTIFDFDRQINSGELDRKSNIRRGWNMRHSIRRKVLEHLQLNLTYAYKADDFGKLIVESQSQLVEEDNNDHTFGFGMSFTPSSIFSLGTNYTYRLDRKWDHEYVDLHEERLLSFRNRHENLGMSITYRPSEDTNLGMRGSRSRQRSGVFDSFNVSYTRNI